MDGIRSDEAEDEADVFVEFATRSPSILLTGCLPELLSPPLCFTACVQ